MTKKASRNLFFEHCIELSEFAYELMSSFERNWIQPCQNLMPPLLKSVMWKLFCYVLFIFSLAWINFIQKMDSVIVYLWKFDQNVHCLRISVMIHWWIHQIMAKWVRWYWTTFLLNKFYSKFNDKGMKNHWKKLDFIQGSLIKSEMDSS